jgi:hypothetical protein
MGGGEMGMVDRRFEGVDGEAEERGVTGFDVVVIVGVVFEYFLGDGKIG